MRAIWQDRFVEESNLTFNIKMLRKALGDDATRPRFIETVPRSGYRFIAPITRTGGKNGFEIKADLLHGADTTQIPADVTSEKRRRLVPALLVVLLIGLVAVGVSFLLIRKSGGETVVPVLSPSSTSESLAFAGNISHPRVSPN